MPELTDEEKAELAETNEGLAAWARFGIENAVESLRRHDPTFATRRLDLADVRAIVEEAASAAGMGIVLAMREHGVRLRVPKPDEE